MKGGRSVGQRVNDDVDADGVTAGENKLKYSLFSPSRSHVSETSVLWVISTISRPRESSMPR